MADPASFAAPWEARTFAIVRSLRDSGTVSADEWTDALTTVVGRGQVEVRYEHWLGALERVLDAKGLVSRETLARYGDAWSQAARRTPHGEPITLTVNDFRPERG
jgi:hypothetical protein